MLPISWAVMSAGSGKPWVCCSLSWWNKAMSWKGGGLGGVDTQMSASQCHYCLTATVPRPALSLSASVNGITEFGLSQSFRQQTQHTTTDTLTLTMKEVDWSLLLCLMPAPRSSKQVNKRLKVIAHRFAQ